jgi:tetratricopeptide (TPR) repeat protein
VNREITGERPHFRPVKRTAKPYRLLFWVCLILAGIWFLMRIDRGQVKPLFLPTPTPTRTANSFVMEAEAQFEAGNLEGAIAAYQQAVEVEPGDALAWAELARIQTYSSSLLSTDEERFNRLEEALHSIDQAVAINPDDADAHAIRSFVLDWYISNPLVPPEDVQARLNDAEASAVRALQLDSQHALALAFFAEILVDQQKWSQAQETIEQAVARDPDSMDVQRVYGYVWESLAQYRNAIESYQAAAEINPNLTFLYIFIGRNYQSLEVYNRALEEFEKAAQINEQLGINDPVPYIEIAKTYTRDGEFFAAALNAEKALTFNPANPNTYGQLGSIYMKARNFEGALIAFRCAVHGCSASENLTARELLPPGQNEIDVVGLPLTSGTVGFYYLQYASVLAALSRPNQNYCDEARQVLNEVQDKYPEDELFNSIIAENRAICNLVEGGRLPAGTQATAVPDGAEGTQSTPVPDPAMEEEG